MIGLVGFQTNRFSNPWKIFFQGLEKADYFSTDVPDKERGRCFYCTALEIVEYGFCRIS
jgi:hypothetical protein